MVHIFIFCNVLSSIVKFKGSITIKIIHKADSIVFWSFWAKGGAENYINSIIDVLSPEYECLIVAESKSTSHCYDWI